MSDPARRTKDAAPSEPKERVYVDRVLGLLDAEQTGKRLLGGISDHQVDRLRQFAGLPAIDLSIGTTGRRAKGLFRYDPVAVREWWRSRQNGGGQ